MTYKAYPLQEVSIGSETITYRTAGHQGPQLVLIHGNMSSSAHVEILMAALESDYRLVAFDLRGMGGSTYNQAFDSLHDLADDMAKAMQALNLEKSHVFGWSTGGGVAMSLAARYPSHVASLILMSSVGPSGYPMFEKGPDFQPILESPLLTKEAIAADPVQVAPVLEALRKRDKGYYKGLWDMLIYVAGNQPEPDLYDYYLEDMLTQRNLVDVDYALTRFNITDTATAYGPGDGSIQRISQPTLILYGEKDLVVPRYMTDAIYAMLPGPKDLRILPDCGHNPLIDHMDLVTTAIKEHIHGGA